MCAMVETLYQICQLYKHEYELSKNIDKNWFHRHRKTHFLFLWAEEKQTDRIENNVSTVQNRFSANRSNWIKVILEKVKR